MDSWVTILPPLAAIALAIISRQVILSLFMGIWMGWTILSGWHPLTGLVRAIDALVAVFGSAYNTKVILFSALVGSLILLTQRSGGVEGFVGWMRRRRVGTTRRSSLLMAWVTGVLVFVESSITCLVVGSVARPLTDQVRVSREKLAYVCDSTSAPVCVLIPLNAWGAYVMGLLAQQGIERPLDVLLTSIPLNFYALAALALTFLVVTLGWDIGPMKRAERRAREQGKLLADGALPLVSSEVLSTPAKLPDKSRAINMVLPVLTMIGMMPLGLYWTGRSALAEEGAQEMGFFAIMGEGSGATAVLWAVLAAIAVALAMTLIQRIFSLHEAMELVLKGAGGLIPMAVIMMLAFAINSTCEQLGTGQWVAAAAEPLLAPALVPVVLFLVACVIAFSTGTSWGTFGIMMPIGVPLALELDLGLSLAVGAVLSGGIFGDHCSPISDTSVISSMACASDHVDHVRTQLPYALIAAALALAAFLVAGLAMA